MNYKVKIKKKLNKEKKTTQTALPQIDLKQPIDMKQFWRQINLHHFTGSADKTAHDIHHLVKLFSRHEKNNPVLVTKLLGLLVYIDNSNGFGYKNNSNVFDSGSSHIIKDEIALLEKKMEEIEQNNMNNVAKIKVIANEKENDEEMESFPLDFNSDQIKLQRYDNLIEQIFRLQMKQFSESISRIKRDTKANWYLVQFDPSEQIENQNLSAKDYAQLIGFRDPFNSISVHDLFQEKTFSY